MIRLIFIVLIINQFSYTQSNFNFAGFDLKFGMDKDYLKYNLEGRDYAIDEASINDTTIILNISLEGDLLGVLVFRNNKLSAATKFLGNYENIEVIEVFYKLFNILTNFNPDQISVLAEEVKELTYNDKHISFYLSDESWIDISVLEVEKKMREGEVPSLTITHSIKE